MLHIPPKNFVCCIPNAVSQTKWTPKEWNNTTRNIDDIGDEYDEYE